MFMLGVVLTIIRWCGQVRGRKGGGRERTLERAYIYPTPGYTKGFKKEGNGVKRSVSTLD